jgi:superfamily II DNA/RNA helicase
MDLFGRGKIMLNDCTLLVIDEADRMLDMGFIPDIEEICTKLPPTRQTLLFSATMPGPIKKLADKFLSNPKQIEVSRPASANLQIEQRIVEVSSRGKKDALIEILRAGDVTTAIVFSNRKTTVRELSQSLSRAGFKAGQIQGDMDQSERIKELDRFKAGEITVLVASDVAARGLDVKGVSHVVNYDVPWHPDDYVHRIGRTGRAGATGKAFTLATPEDAEAVANIEKLTSTKIERVGKSAVAAAARENEPAREKPARRPRKAAEPRVEKPAPAPRVVKANPEPRPRAVEDDGDDDGWNGPLPGFLGVRLT